MCGHFLHSHFTSCKLIFHPSHISIEIQTGTHLATSEKAWLTEVWALELPAYFKFKHHWQDSGASGPSSSISSHFHNSQFLLFAVCLSQIPLHWDRSAQTHQWYHGDYNWLCQNYNFNYSRHVCGIRYSWSRHISSQTWAYFWSVRLCHLLDLLLPYKSLIICQNWLIILTLHNNIHKCFFRALSLARFFLCFLYYLLPM